MKKISFFLMAVLFSFAASIQAAEVTETITMKGFAGSKATSYENVTKTGASDLGTEMVAYAFNPSNGQVRGNKTAIAGATVTSADNAKNWSLYNSQAMPGAIKSIKVTQNATGSNKFQNNLFVALGTTNQGAVTTVTGAQKNTTGTATEFTFEIDETQGYTYFKLLSNVKFTSGSIAGVVVTVTYVTGDEDPDATKYTVTTKVNDETMGTVTGAGEYAEGKTATLTANPNTGYKFVNWSNGETANPLKLTVTENIEITANFAAIPPMTCAEAAATASGETVVLNPFDVVYVVKDAGYIYIKDESGFNLIYDYNLDDKLKAGDHVEGFVGVSSPYNGLPELKASVSYNELTVTSGVAPEPTVMDAAPTKAELNQYVKFENVTLTANATFTTSSATNATMVVNGTNVTLRNNFKLAATLSKDKTYDLVGFVAIYNSTIQVYFLSATEVVLPTKYNVTAAVNDSVMGTVAGAGEYIENAEATLTATPAEGYEFVNWTVDSTEVSTENPYTFVVTADVALVANFKAVVVEPVMETVYFVNAASWTGTINAYAWVDNGATNAAWPGAAATKEAEQIGGYDVYSYTAEAGKYANVIFNGTGGQTADLKWTADKYYVLDGWYTKEEAEAKLATPIVDEVVYFVNNKKWSKVNAYAWDPANAAWPGKAATKEAEQIGGFDVYSYSAAPGTYQKVIFNDGGSNQTADMVWTAGKYIVNNKWYSKEEAEAALAAPVVTTWTMVGDAALFGTGWDLNATANDLVKQADGSWVLTLKEKTLDAKSYEYKAAKDRAWTTTVPGGNNAKLTISKAGKYNITFTLNSATTSVTAKSELIPNVYTVTATAENGTVTGAGEYTEGTEATLVATANEGYEFVNWTEGENVVSTEATYTFTVTKNVTLVANFQEVAPAVEVMELTMTNLQVQSYGEATGLWASDMDNGIEVMLFLDAEGNLMEESSINVSWMDYAVTGTVTKAYDETLATDVYTAELYTTVGETNYKLIITMYYVPAVATPVVVENAVIDDQTETSGFMYMNGEWTDAEGVVYPVSAEVPGFDATVAEAVYKNVTVTVGGWGDTDPWLGFVQGDATITVVENVVTLTGVMSSWDGLNLDITITGTLPKGEEPEVVKPEPVYEENTLNPFAFGLESELSADKATLTVIYRLNNSNATSVDVVVYNGTEVVATVPGTTTIGKNTVEVATAGLPGGVELTWGIVVKGTSVDVPTQEAKMYNMYCPHGLAIDKDPESEYFGRILVADAMDIVKDKAGYLGYGIGAGLHVFNPSFTTDSTVYQGGNDFTRILASNGYQPWRVKISEDGRIFVSSLDLNGVVVWEVSKDLQTWTPVIAGTNDATDYNIYEDSVFVAGPNCSMDVVGSGENLKLLLYSTNNKGIAFNQSGYRLDEYALGTATTWTGAPKNILTGGAYGVVHTNVEFIYDGEGGYWFGGSRAGNAGQPNLVHINAAGEQDYYTEDASLYGGDGVLVHNGMLFKGKARTSGTVGNFGVWTIGKDADGKVTLTEKWAVVANGIGRNLNEFAVDYAENLYVVGNSGEKIIAYALPYSGEVTTPAAAKYAFQLPEPVKMVGTVKRAVQNGQEVIVLTHEADGAAHIYRVVDGVAVAEISQEGVVPVDPENKGSYLAISDIAVTEDGKLVANNYVRNQFAGTTPEAGYKEGTSYYYIWNDLAGAPAVWFTSQTTARSSHGDVGVTFALKGTSTNAELLVTAVHNNNRAVRLAKYNIIDGQYVEPNIPGGEQSNDYYEYYGLHTTAAYYKEATQGKQFQLSVSPLGDNNWIMDGELVDPSEFVLPAVGEAYEASAVLNENLGQKFNGASYVTVGEQVLMVAPYASPVDGELYGVEILDITNGLANALYVDMLYLDEHIAATAAATAVEVVEGDEATSLLITLVADATIYSLEATIGGEIEYQAYEDEITNLVIDLDNLLLIGGPSSAFQVEVVLGLGDYNRNDDTYQLLPESSVSLMGTEATFVEGYAYEVDAFTPSAKAVVKVQWNGMYLELHLNMSAAPLEATKVVVENATIEIEKYLIWGDMYDYALKMTGVWHNAEDGLDYPVLVEVPVYYPEATEPSTIFSTVTVGGWGDNDPWLGFGEGDLTITTVGNTITATGIVQNPMAGVAIDITISGTITPSSVENATVTVKSVKMIKNGQLVIEKDGVQYNAQGATVK